MQSSVPVAFPSQVFNEIRNEHFSNVFSFLSQKARNLQAQYDVRLLPGASVCFLGGSQAAASLMLLLGRDWGSKKGWTFYIFSRPRWNSLAVISFLCHNDVAQIGLQG